MRSFGVSLPFALPSRSDGFVITGIVALVVIHLFITVTASVIYDRPVGADFIFHWSISRDMLSHGIYPVMTGSRMLASQGIPYPPGIHILFMFCQQLPSRSDGLGISVVLFMQVLMFPLILVMLLYVAYRGSGSLLYVFVVGVFLTGAFGFFDRCWQVIPQSFEVLLFAIAIVAYMWGGARRLPSQQRRTDISWYIVFVSCVAGMFVFHAPASILLVVPFVMYGLIDKYRFAFSYTSALLCVIPLVYYAGWMSFILPRFSGSLYAQKIIFLDHPLVFSVVYLGPLFFVTFPHMFKLRWSSMSELNRFMLVTLFCMFPMAIFWPARLFTYIAIPLSFLIPSAIGHKANMKMLPVYLAFAAMIVVVKILILGVLDA